MSKEYLEALYRLATRNNGNRRSDEEVDKDFRIVEKALKKYESIDNANPSEALEIINCKLVDVFKLYNCNTVEEYNQVQYRDCRLTDYEFNLLKQWLSNKQEPKQYLKWEDLEFGENKHKLKAKMNDNLYRIEWFIDGMGFKTVNIYLYVAEDYLEFCTCLQGEKKQFFNNLHLERVEE